MIAIADIEQLWRWQTGFPNALAFFIEYLLRLGIYALIFLLLGASRGIWVASRAIAPAVKHVARWSNVQLLDGYCAGVRAQGEIQSSLCFPASYSSCFRRCSLIIS